MGRAVTTIARASWWQVGFLIVLALLSLLDLTLPRVLGGIVLLALALVITVCKLLARGEKRGASVEVDATNRRRRKQTDG